MREELIIIHFKDKETKVQKGYMTSLISLGWQVGCEKIVDTGLPGARHRAFPHGGDTIKAMECQTVLAGPDILGCGSWYQI